jgi:hypothetical protein
LQITHYPATLLIAAEFVICLAQNIPVPVTKITAARISALSGEKYHYHIAIKSDLSDLLNYFYKVL